MKKILYIITALIVWNTSIIQGKTILITKSTNLTQTIQDASDDDTLKLDCDLTNSCNIYFIHELTLDLAGHTIEGASGSSPIIVLTSGSLEIIDSSSDKSGMIRNNLTHETHAIRIENSSTMTVNGGTITGFNGINVACGTLNINDGKIIGRGYTNSQIVSASQGYGIFQDNSYASNTVVINISGGTVYGYVKALSLLEKATCTITGGSFTTNGWYTITVGGKLTISGNAIVTGSNNSSTSVGILNSGGTTTIEGGYFSCNTSSQTHYPVRNNASKSTGKLYIHGGYYTEKVAPIPTGYYCNDNDSAAANYPYHVTTEGLTVYEGNSTVVTDTIRQNRWQTIQTTYPNAMAVVSKDYQNWAERQNNILVHQGDGASPEYTCHNFVLTDLKDFYTPYDFTAENASYTRATTLQYNSLCLPFTLTPQDVSGTIYTFGNYNSDNSTVSMREQTEGTAAGVPCILKATTAGSALNVTKTNASILQSVNDNGNIKGSYTTKTGFGGDGIYKLNSSGTAFGITTASAKCSPFRSYLDLSGNNAKPSSLNITWENGSATSIDIINNAGTASYPSEHFSLNGTQTNSNSHGLHVIRKENGHCIKVNLH